MERTSGSRLQLLTPCLDFVHATNGSAHFMDEANEAREGHSSLNQNRAQDYGVSIEFPSYYTTSFLKVSILERLRSRSLE